MRSWAPSTGTPSRSWARTPSARAWPSGLSRRTRPNSRPATFPASSSPSWNGAIPPGCSKGWRRDAGPCRPIAFTRATRAATGASTIPTASLRCWARWMTTCWSRARTCACTSVWARIRCATRMPGESISRSGRPTRGGCRWWAISTPGTAEGPRCAAGSTAASGRSSFRRSAKALSTSTRSSDRPASCCR